MNSKIKTYSVFIDDVAKGIIYIYLDEKHKAYFRDIFVRKDMRGKGFGNKLLSLLEEKSIELGCDTFILRAERRTCPYDWYKKHGYRDYAPDMNDNAYFWMKKSLEIPKINKNLCLRDKTKECNLCHDCDVYILNPNY